MAGLILAIGLLPIACGSSGGADTTKISRAAFLTKAKAICQRGNAKRDKQYNRWAERAHLHADSEEFMNKKAEKFILPVKVQKVKELRALELPEVGKEKLETFLVAMEEGIEKGKRDPSTLRVGDYAFQRAFEMAESVGLQVCFIG
jgi:hypothetical protein